MGEGIYVNGVRVEGGDSRRISASTSVKDRRRKRNAQDADELERQGYIVERNKHPNGAYFAQIGKHPEHEQNVGRIFAENGFAFTLDKEGNGKVKINGRLYILPSPDGRVEGFTHEIYALNGKPNPQKVADAIKHSYKPFRFEDAKSVQSEIAISVAPIGSKYNRRHISDGVKEYKRQVAEGETKAMPLLYLHVNETTRSIYRWSIK